MGLSFALGWLPILVVNSGFIARLPLEREGKVQALHHLYEAGHVLFLAFASGLLAFIGRKIWKRLRGSSSPTARWAYYFGWIALLFSILAFLLDEDLTGFINRKAQAGSNLPWFWIIVLGASLSCFGAGALALWVRRTPLRWLFPLVGLALAFANQLLLTGSYPGLHFVAAAFSATSSALFLWSTKVPGTILALPKPWIRLAGVVWLLGALSAVTLVPPTLVWKDLFRLSGSVVPPFLARVYPVDEVHADAGELNLKWYRAREGLPPIPPSERNILPENPIVLLLTVDALRADLFQPKRYEKVVPHLTRLRDSSLFFTHARSPSSSTATTFAAVYAGKYYSGMRWTSRKENWAKQGKAIWPSKDESPRVPQILTAGGVRTVNFRLLDMFSDGKGVTRGFAEEQNLGHYVKAPDAAQAIVSWLETLDERPAFAAAHFIDPHAPYNRGNAKKAKSQFEKYLAEVAYVDRELGRVVEAIEKSKERKRIILIVASDHGEAFGEHNTKFHAATLYEELLRVPFLVHGASIEARKTDAPVSLIDLGPTLLDIFGRDTPATFLGQSLVPFLEGSEVELTRPLAAESGRLIRSIILPSGLKAIVDSKKKTREVYDLLADPKERRNLVGEDERADEALARLQAFFDAHRLPNYEPPWREF